MPETLTDSQPATQYFRSHAKSIETLRIGRPRGSRNKVTVNIKESVEQVFNALGGVKGFLYWAMDNPDAFYGQVLPKLLPKDLSRSSVDGLKVYIYGEQVNVSQPNHQPVTIDAALTQIPQALEQAGVNLPNQEAEAG